LLKHYTIFKLCLVFLYQKYTSLHFVLYQPLFLLSLLLYYMSRPTHQYQSNGFSCNSHNGGLIDFQDSGLFSNLNSEYSAPNVAPPMTSMANLAGFMTQPNVMALPQMSAPATLIPTAPSPVTMSQLPMCQGQVLYGPPSEMYMNGMIYRCVDSAPTVGQAAAPVVTPVAPPVATPPPAPETKVGGGMSQSDGNVRFDKSKVNARVNQRVAEYQSKYGSDSSSNNRKKGVGASMRMGAAYDTTDEEEALRRLNAVNSRMSKKHGGRKGY
jgi:hypothetical protein